MGPLASGAGLQAEAIAADITARNWSQLSFVLGLVRGSFPDGFLLMPEPLAPDRLSLWRSCLVAMQAEVTAVDRGGKALLALPGLDLQGGVASDALSHELRVRWVRCQMHTDRCIARLMDFEEAVGQRSRIRHEDELPQGRG